uniref:Uncharacterized protein n=1 Tax=Anopheles coluzzii TaxID=1518534 RepID=A0A6E8WD11_ANOCL
MKLTCSVVLTVALVASLCTASPLLITKHVIKKVVDKHFEPKTVTTHAVVYTPVVAPPPPPVVLAAAPAHHPAVVSPSALHTKLTSTLGSLLKHPLLQHPAPVVPAPVYGVPAATYGLPATGEHSSASSSSSSSSSSSTSSSDGAAKYVAVNPGARHEAPLPGYDHSVVLENLEPAPGTEGLTMLVPPVVSNELHHWNPEPVVLRGEDMLSSDYLRMAHDVATGGANSAEPVEARYVAINNGVRHEAPLPGYDRSIVIENADTV